MYSIIIPVYNAEAYLRECLDSVLAQSYKDWECILVDDGSPDGSGAICDEYVKHDVRFKVIHKTNEGISIARNTGIEIAKGEWISFIDADDSIEPNYLETFDAVKDKADLTFFGNHWLTDDGCNKSFYLPTRTYTGWEEMQKGMLLLKKNCANYDYYGFTWNKFFRADIIREHNVRFVPGVTMKEDELFVDDFIVHADKLSFLHDVLYRYRWKDGGLTASQKSIECLTLYSEHSENFLKSLDNIDLLSYQIMYIFNVRYGIYLRKIPEIGQKKSLQEVMTFVRKYHDKCNTPAELSLLPRALWNYDLGLKNRLITKVIKWKNILKKILVR